MSKERSDESEFLPISEEELDKRHQAVNEVAVKQLPMLFADLDEAMKDKELLDQYETDFLGDLYARMIVSVYMGYFPQKMGKDAEDGAMRLMKASGVDMEEVEDEEA